MKLKQQIRRILLLEGLTSFRPAGSLWVLLLAGRGFSLAEIGIAEGLFHVVSFCCEVPSGMLADLLGRKKTMVASQLMFAFSTLCWLLSRDMAGVCLAMAVNALGFNLASGTREALSYDSLLQYKEERRYLKLSSLQNTLYHLGSAAALLLAGVTVAMGWRLAYGVDFALSLLAAAVTMGLWEPVVTETQGARDKARLADVPAGIRRCGLDAVHFLRATPRAAALMLLSAGSGTVATLYRFFLQDALPRAGAPAVILGALLVLVALGQAGGSKAAAWLGRLPYRAGAGICLCAVALGFATVATGHWALMTAGGVLCGFFDEVLAVLTDNRLNGMIPSDRRATLMSVSSMTFSLVMIVASPLAGILASVAGL